MLKFGQQINLDVLDRMGTSKNVEELKEALKKQEAMQAAELNEWRRKMAAAQAELTEVCTPKTPQWVRWGQQGQDGCGL
jgi:hypothetical protein